MMRSRPFGLALLLVSGLSACASQGPTRLPPDRFDYNQAISRSANEQMLLNLVRLRYSEIPVFLAVTSVLTQYSYGSTIGVRGSGGASFGDPLWQVGASGNFVYIERPTITYAPLTGDNFAKQLIEPIPTEMVFSLVSSGWPPRDLLLMTMFRLNDKLNMAFEMTPEAFERFDDFKLIVDQIIELARRDAMEVEHGEESKYLVFDRRTDPETRQLIAEFKTSLGLDAELSKFRITHRHMDRKPDEVTMRVRSILELMGFLSRGVEIPPAHQEQNFAEKSTGWDDETPRRIPLHVHAQVEPPQDAFVAIYFQDHWYYIAQSDHRSKKSFGLLEYLFQMQAPQLPTMGPLLTVPTG
ncbi:MAG: hypothetical protein E2O40_01780 [Planctomycetota bacterium]|nr:MAG: hypothetical protein E2O40_01780 [Planctomycetota bacterium]